MAVRRRNTRRIRMSRAKVDTSFAVDASVLSHVEGRQAVIQIPPTERVQADDDLYHKDREEDGVNDHECGQPHRACATWTNALYAHAATAGEEELIGAEIHKYEERVHSHDHKKSNLNRKRVEKDLETSLAPSAPTPDHFLAGRWYALPAEQRHVRMGRRAEVDAVQKSAMIGRKRKRAILGVWRLACSYFSVSPLSRRRIVHLGLGDACYLARHLKERNGGVMAATCNAQRTVHCHGHGH
eukprot:scaffold19425_cov129-Isochrysis_galbana.AAC.4